MIFDKIFGATSTLANPDPWLLEAFGAGPAYSGEVVNIKTALKVSAVFSCIKVLSESIAQLPIHLLQTDKNGNTQKAIDHPLYSLLHDLPNPNITAFDYKQMIMVNLGLGGTDYNRIHRDRRGQIGELEPIEPWRVRMLQNKETRNLFYDLDGNETLASRDIWRNIGFSANGLQGLPPVDLSKEAIGILMAAERATGKMYKNGAIPSGIVTTGESGLTPDALKILKKEFASLYSGSDNAGETVFLDAGQDFKLLKGDPTKYQFIENHKLQITQIAGRYRVPPHMIGDLERATFSNIEHQAIEFVVHSLGPWLKRIEETISRDLLTPTERLTYKAKFNFNALLRGDTESRNEAYVKAITNGWLSRNEVREYEDLNKVEGLEVFLTPMNMDNGQAERQENEE